MAVVQQAAGRKRRLFTILSALSLLVLVAVLVLWVRSFWWEDTVRGHDPGQGRIWPRLPRAG